MKYVDHLQDWLFRLVHQNNLIYNTCWEDPRCDRQMLGFNQDSEVVMITSAGCNALDYLLDDPKAIHAIDMNPRQNALLDLKKASLSQLYFEDHFTLFGAGKHPDFSTLYTQQLRQQLPAYAQEIWDRSGNYFSGKAGRKTMYYYGTSGMLAWLLRGYLKARPKINRDLKALFAADTLEEQIRIYDALEPRLLNQLVHWAVNRHFTMCLIGVPQSQQALFKDEYERGITGFLQDCLRRVFRTLPIKDNYFWQLYYQGYYQPDCAPNYLQEQHFETLKNRQERIQTYNNTLSGFLKENPGAYTQYILLDHQDWLAAHDLAGLVEEWELILENSRSGTRILMRSAADKIDFIPAFVHQRVDFKSNMELADIHAADRVATYASVQLGIVK
ncbi:DUF3419 family protein [Lewinella sp. LCG006]|uniref:DUF3419 family protein n=1 Tax=Lewinella sp. LCG006 TaxID=3231911 RepID=UPI003460A203